MKTQESLTFQFLNYSLREPDIKDAEELISITNDQSVMEYYGTEGSYLKSRDDALKQIAWMKASFHNCPGRWVIADERDRYIGDIGFYNFDSAHKRVELGFKLKREYWGRGIISGFLGLLREYAFRDYGINRMEAYIDERNVGSKKVVMKNGFTCEGTLREYEYEHGRFVNLELYSLLRSDLKGH